MKASEIIKSGFTIVREDDLGHAIIELDGLYYIVKVDRQAKEFQSVLPCDLHPDGGGWLSRWTGAGLRYVASGRSRNAAMAQWRKHIVPRTEALAEEARLRQEVSEFLS